MPPDRMVLALVLQLICLLKHLLLGFPWEPCCRSFILNLLHMSANYHNRMSQTRQLIGTVGEADSFRVLRETVPGLLLRAASLFLWLHSSSFGACLPSCHLLSGSACVLLFFKDLLLFMCIHVSVWRNILVCGCL